MTSTQRTDPNQRPESSFQCYLSGSWLPYCELVISIDDQGFRQGVTAVERLRTHNGKIFCCDAHLDRWQRTVSELRIDNLPDRDELARLLQELLTRNEPLLGSEGDIGITMFATPGQACGAPTIGMHLNRLDHATIARRQQEGQPLIITDVRQPDPGCWPRTIKVRSRLHYYLADQQARERDPDSVGVLIDSDGTVTETSIANLAMVRSGQLTSPPQDRVLGGITQSVCQSVASQLNLAWTTQPIPVTQLAQADEILLMGTDGGVWFANSIDGNAINERRAGPVYRQLSDGFNALACRSRIGSS